MMPEDGAVPPAVASPRRLGLHNQGASQMSQQPHSPDISLPHVQGRTGDFQRTLDEQDRAGEIGQEGLEAGEGPSQRQAPQASPLESLPPDAGRGEYESEGEVENLDSAMSTVEAHSMTDQELIGPLTESMEMDDVDSSTGLFQDMTGTLHEAGSPPAAMTPTPFPFPATASAMQSWFAHMIPPVPPPTADTGSAILVIQALVATSAGIDEDNEAITWFQDGPFISPNTLGSNNLGLTEFLHEWALERPTTFERYGYRGPLCSKVHEQISNKGTTAVHYDDLQGDRCDLQGLDWLRMGVTRREARRKRLRMYQNYVTYPDSDLCWGETVIPRTDSFFRFRRMDIRRNVHIAHFQLRHVLASTSRTNIFYTGDRSVHHFNTATAEARVALKSGRVNGQDVSALDAGHGMLVAGGFGGNYVLERLYSEEDEETSHGSGVITNHANAITNHVRIEDSRSSGPRLTFASNDWGFRVMDLGTETWLSHEDYSFALNCTALSPDRRLRVAVGDHCDVFIAAAEPTGSNDSNGGKAPDVQQQIRGHRDWGFACDWADDGWTVATGFQDQTVKIWDARKWVDSSGNTQPVHELRSEMAGVRSLRFSPIGSGRRVLVAAEEADMVDIYDARSFESKQTFDVFGEIGGTTFVNDGQDLIFLVGDRARGGLVHLERCGEGIDMSGSQDEAGTDESDEATYDWPPSQFTGRGRIKQTETQRRRAAAMLHMLEPF